MRKNKVPELVGFKFLIVALIEGFIYIPYKHEKNFKFIQNIYELDEFVSLFLIRIKLLIS